MHNFNPLCIPVCNFTGGGVDYSSGSYNVTIPAGQTSISFDVLINDDNLFEENKECLLTINQSSSLNGIIIGSPNVAVVNIFDNDGEFKRFAYNATPFKSRCIIVRHVAQVCHTMSVLIKCDLYVAP